MSEEKATKKVEEAVVAVVVVVEVEVAAVVRVQGVRVSVAVEHVNRVYECT